MNALEEHSWTLTDDCLYIIFSLVHWNLPFTLVVPTKDFFRSLFRITILIYPDSPTKVDLTDSQFVSSYTCPKPIG